MSLQQFDFREDLLAQHVERNKFLFEHRHLQLMDEQINGIALLMSVESHIPIQNHVAKGILDLQPEARIKMAAGKLDDETAAVLVRNALAMFLLGCNWPTEHDNVDMVEFRHLLREQAMSLGIFRP